MKYMLSLTIHIKLKLLKLPNCKKKAKQKELFIKMKLF